MLNPYERPATTNHTAAQRARREEAERERRALIARAPFDRAADRALSGQSGNSVKSSSGSPRQAADIRRHSPSASRPGHRLRSCDEAAEQPSAASTEPLGRHPPASMAPGGFPPRPGGHAPPPARPRARLPRQPRFPAGHRARPDHRQAPRDLRRPHGRWLLPAPPPSGPPPSSMASLRVRPGSTSPTTSTVVRSDDPLLKSEWSTRHPPKHDRFRRIPRRKDARRPGGHRHARPGHLRRRGPRDGRPRRLAGRPRPERARPPCAPGRSAWSAKPTKRPRSRPPSFAPDRPP